MPDMKAENKSTAVLSMLVILAAALTFLPALFCEFLADDFTNIKWLSQKPLETLALRLQGIQIANPAFGQHFRPLLMLFYLIDIQLFKNNPVLLHFSNLFYHIVSCIICFGLLQKLFTEFQFKNCRWLAFWSSLIFAVHPLHYEVLTWWSAKADLVNSLFCLLSFYLFLKAREISNKALYFASLLCFVIAISCKESAFSLPFVFFVFLIMRQGADQKIKKKLGSAVIETAPYFLLLFAFLLLRTYMLGTAFGGYYGLLTDHYFDISLKRFISWTFPFVFLFPVFSFNSFIQNVMVLCFSLVYAGTCLLYARTVQSSEADSSEADSSEADSSEADSSETDSKRWPDKRVIALSFFLVSTIIILAPVAVVWTPIANLENTRLLYLAVMPLSTLIPLLLSASFRERIPVLLLSAYLMLLYSSSQIMNIRYISASRACAELKQDLLNRLKGGENVYLLAMDNTISGIPLKMQFFLLEDMLNPTFQQWPCKGKLFAARPDFINSASMVNPSLLKEAAEKGNFQFTYGRAEQSTGGEIFKLINADLSHLLARRSARVEPLKCKEFAESGNWRFYNVMLTNPVSGADRQFLRLRLKKPVTKGSLPGSLQIRWKEKSSEPEARMNLFLNIKDPSVNSGSDLLLSPGERLEWLLCKEITSLQIAAEFEIASIELLAEESVLPSFRPAGNFIQSNDSILQGLNGKILFDYDLSKIPGAENAVLEISHARHEFSKYSGKLRERELCSLAMKHLKFQGNKGRIELDLRLGSPVWHQVRLFAMSKEGKALAFSSDPFFVQSCLR